MTRFKALSIDPDTAGGTTSSELKLKSKNACSDAAGSNKGEYIVIFDNTNGVTKQIYFVD